LYQDNKSAILLETNGKKSSWKRTQALNIRYFFLTDQVEKGNVTIVYCPTDDMVGDFHTSKPLQGEKFRNFTKYPDDPGDQPINDDDVVLPANHLWANHEESQTWRKTITRKSNTYCTTYGLCCNCYTSGPNNMGCLDGCTTGEYKTIQYGDYTFDCQTIAEKLGKHHTTAMAGRKQVA
jgi:hypothetical protein